MKLQLALDNTLENALEILHAVHPYVDIAEIGTPLVFREGMNAVRRLRAAYPDLVLLADFKIMDAGYAEAAIAFDAGTDWVTAMGVANDNTLRGVVEAASEYGRHVMVDMMSVPVLVLRAKQLLDLGVDLLCVHTAHDLQSDHSNPLDMLASLRAELPDAPLAVAGGIDLALIEALAVYTPQVLVVGSAITQSKHPATAAQVIRQRMDEVIV